MAVSIPQVVTEDRASGAQFIDGSLKFDGSKSTRLTKTFASAGNRTSWTWSCWVKRDILTLSNRQVIFGGYGASNDTDWLELGFDSSNDKVYFTTSSISTAGTPERRDPTGWYHFFSTYDGSNLKIYVNNNLDLNHSFSGNRGINNNTAHYIGQTPGNAVDRHLDGRLTQCYFIDGQVLNPSDFAYTDPLTNTWRPKKYDGTFGTNGFWLPMDGNSPIGKDQSGRGNDWTPVNFGGSVALDNPQANGALPILNTTPGGRVATAGVRDDSYASDIVMAIPFLGNVNDISADIRGSGSNLSVTTSGSPAADSYPDQWYGSSFNVSTGNYIDTIGTTTTFAFLHQPEAAGTVEGWINTNAVNVQGPWFQTSNGTDQVGVMFRQNSTTNLAVQINRGVAGQAIVVDSSVTVALNTWYHWAFVKSADGYAQFFLNGVPTGSKVPISTAAGASNAASTNTSSSFAGRIAKNNGESRGVGANISDYRAYTIQKYAFDTPFIPASTNPDILPETPSGVTGKTNLAKITEGAVAFDGSGDYLSIPGDTDLQMGTGDFTIECYFNVNGAVPTSCWRGMISLGGFTTDNGITIYAPRADSPVDTVVVILNRVNPTMASTINIKHGWHHVALVRNSGTTKLYVDGIEQSSISDTNNYDYSGTVYIGRDADCGTTYYEGFISNVRITKGQALYTSNFTPSTEPLTTSSQGATPSNVKLLCCQSNTSAVTAAVTPGTFVNDGTNYSSGNQVTGSAGLRDVDSIFDGHLRVSGNPLLNEGATVNISSDNYILWTPTTGIPYSSKVEVYCYAANGYEITNYYTFNGGTETTFTGGSSNFNGNNWITVATGSGTINSIKIRITRGSGNQTSVNWYAVRVDGTILINDYNGKSIGKYDNTSATNFNPFNTDINTVRGQETGYATLNPLDKGSSSTLSDGNLRFAGVSSAHRGVRATIKPTVKIYAEMIISHNETGIGFASSFVGLDNSTLVNGKWVVYNNQLRSNGSSIASITTLGAGEIIQVAYDPVTTASWIGRNNKWYDSSGTFTGNPATGANATFYIPDAFIYVHSFNAYVVDANFGQKPFKFPPPDGFQPLSLSSAQPENVIARPDKYVGVTIYTGDGNTSGRSINIGFRPDLIWLKSRGSGNHGLYDSVRGPDKRLKSDGVGGEDTVVFPGASNFGFDFGSETYYNGSSTNYVAWTWKAGGNKNTFNIDDVGYANASDVNMNVGGLNSQIYNDDQVWSSGLSGSGSGGGWASNEGPTVAFNGDTDTRARWTGTSSGVITASFTAISATKLRVKGHFFKNSTTANEDVMISVNGGTYVIPSDAGLITYDEIQAAAGNNLFIDASSLITGGQVSSVSIKRRGSVSSASGLTIYAIEVDGKILVDSNQTPPNAPLIAATGCSVGTKQGFSIVKFTGDSTTTGTIAHGLNKKPQFIIVKDLVNNDDWQIKFVDENRYLKLNATDTGSTSYSNYTATDSVIKLGYTWNNDSSPHIAYSWHDVPGLQKFGIYEGNTTEGAFVELGFRPAIIWIKSIDQTWYWNIHDSKRGPINPIQGNFLRPDQTYVENSDSGNNNIDFLSNGFKIRSTTAQSEPTNVNGQTYFYAAWAEAPSINLYGAQSNAR